MKKHVKSIFFLPLLVVFCYSCNKPEEIKVPNENKNAPAAVTAKEMQQSIPWIDPTVLAATIGC